MKKGILYKVKKGETLESLAADFGISVTQLRTFHNNWCDDIHDQIGYEVKEGMQLTVEKEKLSPEETHQKEEEKKQEEKQQKEEQKQKEEHAKQTEQDDKYFVVHGAKCLCDKGSAPAILTVNSHRKTVFNSRGDDKLAATVEDVQFQEGSSCFGSCQIKNNNPCSYSPAGQWQKPYEKVKVLDKKVLTEISYLMCSVGGKITVQHHGQVIKIGNSNLQRADAETINQILPGINIQEYQAEQDKNNKTQNPQY